MRTYWYDTGSHIQLHLAPQEPAPGRFMGIVDLTRAEFELVERVVEGDRPLVGREAGRSSSAGSPSRPAVGVERSQR
jgi:hypothetical protein